ncbi:hypothetical protein B5E53_15485 [Eubacterium sp. An11]|uniref:hypothetical protein n=1 Tax=Eubacterium sp. An11 TaxID=1965542 RepID=UPI000B36F86D|nr:hypothetical protein [Eubacterium sp. An11]OUQ63666.1 hypothetical protein B5E53_15485 [Eubacterium sp. An11]
MSEKKETVWASLREICDETRTVADETGRKVKKTACFSTMKALLEGAFHLVEYFEKLHREGEVFRSDSADMFRFSLATGEMQKREPAKKEKEMGRTEDETAAVDVLLAAGPVEINEFLAPELVECIKEGTTAEELPFTVETDRYFMAVFLFEYFFHTGSPFEGKKMVNRCFLSPLEKEVFRAEQGQFCMDLGENENTPVKGIQDKLIHYWEEYPDILKKMFQRAFMDGGTLCELRPTEVDWKQTLVRLMMDYQVCGCGFQGFSNRLRPKENGTLLCPVCGKTYYVLSDGMNRILLAEGVKLYACQTGRDAFDKDTVTAVVAENRQKKGLYGIKNVSRGVWRGLFPDGSTREIKEGQGIPIWNGMQVRFETGEEWSLRLMQKAAPEEERQDIESR